MFDLHHLCCGYGYLTTKIKLSSSDSAPQLFGGGWGDDNTTPSEDADADGSSSSGDPSSESEEEEEEEATQTELPDVSSLSTTLKNTSLTSDAPSDTESSASPTSSYPVLYLDTTFEYITPPSSHPSGATAAAKLKKTSESSGDNQWGAEGYERMEGIDDVFERFVTRVENEPQQCVR